MMVRRYSSQPTPPTEVPKRPLDLGFYSALSPSGVIADKWGERLATAARDETESKLRTLRALSLPSWLDRRVDSGRLGVRPVKFGGEGSDSACNGPKISQLSTGPTCALTASQ